MIRRCPERDTLRILTLTGGGNTGTATATSASFTPASAGWYRIRAAYAGDSNYLASRGYLPAGVPLIKEVAALGGDLIKSLFKRQVDIQPGQPWFPFDQCDWLIGVLWLTSQVYGQPTAIELKDEGIDCAPLPDVPKTDA